MQRLSRAAPVLRPTGTAVTEAEVEERLFSTRFAHPSEELLARLLSFYGVAWEYEPHTFVLREEQGRLREAFTPDFYLPELDRYLEITTLRQPLVTDKNRKLRLFHLRYPDRRARILYRRDYYRLCARFGVEGIAEEVPAPAAPEPAAVERRLDRLAVEVSRDYAGRGLLLVGVDEGALPLLGRLAARLSIPASLDAIALTRFGGGDVRASPASDLSQPVADRQVLLLSERLETGLTAHFFRRLLAARGSGPIALCTLIDRPGLRLLEVEPRYVGFELSEEGVLREPADGMHVPAAPSR